MGDDTSRDEFQIGATMRSHYTCHLTWLKLQALTASNAGEEVEQELSFIAGENANGTATF